MSEEGIYIGVSEDKCPNCGALWEEIGFDDVNEFGEAAITCANCGHSETL